MKPEFTRPFNVEHAKAGAPYCCRNGAEATVLMWERRSRAFPLIGVFGINDVVGIWGEYGNFCDSPSSRDLFMIPLGMCEGKPVFVDDILTYGSAKVVAGIYGSHFHLCTWPKPEIYYPKSLMTDGQTLRAIGASAVLDSSFGYASPDSRRAVANAAIRHAIDAGQVAIVNVVTKK